MVRPGVWVTGIPDRDLCLAGAHSYYEDVIREVEAALVVLRPYEGLGVGAGHPLLVEVNVPGFSLQETALTVVTQAL